MKIIWSPLAIDRITEIAGYISEDSPRSAEKWIDSIFKKVSRLKKYPESGRIVPELDISKIREIIYGNYRIIYRIKQEFIVVLTVRHGRQILPEEEIK
jgi:addiction module RelE/StbE family toxin